MNQLLKSMYHGILRALPAKPALYLMYFRGYHRVLDLKHPKYYGEKIQWLKLYGGLEELADYVDKYKVRAYVDKIIGPGHVARLIGVYDRAEEIDFDELPQQFVAKSTNGTQTVLICRDKPTLDIPKARKTMNAWLDERFDEVKKEPQYKNVQSRILIEEYLQDDSGELRDYKFYCFDGKPLWYSVFNGRFSNKTVDTYTIDGQFLPDFQNGGTHAKLSEHPLPKPEQLEELVACAQALAQPFTYVRVDLYLVKGHVYFGELTFTDGAGCEPMIPLEKYDVEFARRIPLSKVLKQQEENNT
ncbi:MAG: glycosyl transferase [Clostridia bacterium]|nr:glycosyl transferase [Clostridia bacterium]